MFILYKKNWAFKPNTQYIQDFNQNAHLTNYLVFTVHTSTYSIHQLVHQKKNCPKKILSKIHKFHKSVQISHINFIKKSIQFVQITDKIYSNFIHKLHKKICSTCSHIKSVQLVQIHSNFIINMSNLFTHKKSIQISSFHSPCKKVL